MAQATFSVRMEKNLKDRFAEICESIGMNMSTAINIFANAVVDKRRIPFDVVAPSNNNDKFMEIISTMRNEIQKSNMKELSLDEINAIIADTRKRKKLNS